MSITRRRALEIMGLGFVSAPFIIFLSYGNPKERQVTIPAEDAKSRILLRDGVILIRLDEGEPLFLSSKCTHLGCTVTLDLPNKVFRCPCHGSIFSITGHNLKGPAASPLPALNYKKNKDKSYTVKVSI